MNLNDWIDALNKEDIKDPIEQAGVLAQIKAESNFTPRSENLNYSAQRLLQVFPNKFTDLQDAQRVVRGGAQAIGDRLYGGRMGNASNEGYRYRGRGYIQLTGKNNYRHYGNLIGEDLVADPDKANDPDIARKIAIAYLKENASGNLHDPYQTTRAVGPAGWRNKVPERAKYQQEFFGELTGLQDAANQGPQRFVGPLNTDVAPTDAEEQALSAALEAENNTDYLDRLFGNTVKTIKNLF